MIGFRYKKDWSLLSEKILNWILHRPIISDGLPCQQVIEIPEEAVLCRIEREYGGW